MFQRQLGALAVCVESARDMTNRRPVPDLAKVENPAQAFVPDRKRQNTKPLFPSVRLVRKRDPCPKAERGGRAPEDALPPTEQA
jgi:hypothetical protein